MSRMSDLAPLFTDVAVVLRCQTVQDLANEIKDLEKKLNSTRLVVYAVDMNQQPRMEQSLAEGFLEQMETLTLADIPERYSSLLDNDNEDDEERRYYAVKLQSTNALIGSMTDFDDIAYIVRLEKEDLSVILGVFMEGSVQVFKHGCLLSKALELYRSDSPNTMVELKQPTKQHFYLERIGCKIASFENHPYWNDVPRRNQQPPAGEHAGGGVDYDREHFRALYEFMDNAPENSAEQIAEYLFFRPVAASEVLQNVLP